MDDVEAAVDEGGDAGCGAEDSPMREDAVNVAQENEIPVQTTAAAGSGRNILSDGVDRGAIGLDADFQGKTGDSFPPSSGENHEGGVRADGEGECSTGSGDSQMQISADQQIVGSDVNAASINTSDMDPIRSSGALSSKGLGPDIDRNIWSYQFLFDVAYAVGQPNRAGFARRPWKKSTVVYNKREGQALSADVTREFNVLNKNRTMDKIQFTVQNPGVGGNTRYFFIMYDSFSGACLVDVVKLAEPCNSGDDKIMQN
jgi:hypothetical protein